MIKKHIEILNSYVDKYEGEPVQFVPLQSAWDAMKEVARLEAIDFGVWLHYNWANILGHGWILQADAIKYNTIKGTMKNLIPIEQVYKLFDESKNLTPTNKPI